MDIINILTLQLSKIETLLKKDLENNSITYNYLINDKENFLSYFKLQSFITSNEIRNIESLTNINQKCNNILELWNLDLKDLPYKELKEGFSYNDDKKQRSLSTTIDFHTISTLEVDNYWSNYNSTSGKKFFVETYDFLNFSIPKIASICINITNLIENQFPDVIVDLSGNYYLNHYLTTGRFELQSYIRPLEKKHFDSFCRRIENYEFRYFFILNSLQGKKQIEFKHDTIDHIRKIYDVQLFSKYKVALNEFIQSIENYGGKVQKQKPREEKSKLKEYTFKEIFIKEDYKKYINALYKVEKPIIDQNWNFIGKQRGHKCVICSWINDLTQKGIIRRYNRQTLAVICNNEIKGFNLGVDGSTFEKNCKEYDEEYKELLFDIIN